MLTLALTVIGLIAQTAPFSPVPCEGLKWVQQEPMSGAYVERAAPFKWEFESRAIDGYWTGPQHCIARVVEEESHPAHVGECRDWDIALAMIPSKYGPDLLDVCDVALWNETHHNTERN